MDEVISQNKRNQTIDTMKGICILSVVIGHAINTANFPGEILEEIRKFLYIFHLPVFFFCSGFTYKEYTFIKFLKNKIKALYIPTIGYNLFSLLIIPFWNIFGFNFEFSKVFIIKKIVNNIKFFNYMDEVGIFTGPLWFVQTFLIAVFFMFIYMYIERKNKIIAFFVLVVVMTLGVKYTISTVAWHRRASVAFLMLPVMIIAKKIDIKKVKTYNYLLFAILSVFLILAINRFTGLQIELSMGELYGGLLFYPMIFLGIFFVFSMAKIIENKHNLAKSFIVLSKYSFTIMALHCIIFKLIDVSYYLVTGKGQDLLYLFPYSYTKLRILYIVLGTLIPIAIGILLNKMKPKSLYKKI